MPSSDPAGQPKKKTEKFKDALGGKGKSHKRTEDALPMAQRRAAMAAVTTAASVQPAAPSAEKVKRKRAMLKEEAGEAKVKKTKKAKKAETEAGAKKAKRDTEEAVIIDGEIDSEGEEGADEAEELTLDEIEERAGRTRHRDSAVEVEAAISSGRRVYVANLPYSTSDEQIIDLFDGHIASVHWIVPKAGFRGSGFLTFLTAAEAAAAVAKSGCSLGGRVVSIDMAAATAPEAESCVFVRNLPAAEWSLAAVRRAYAHCGPILAIRLPKKGKAAIRFKSADAAAAAAARDGEERGGKKVRILLTSSIADPGAKVEAEMRRSRPRPAGAAEIPQQPAVPAQGENGYRSSHDRRGGPRERAHSRQRRPRQGADEDEMLVS